MKKTYIYIFCFLVTVSSISGQEPVYSPSIAILYPYEKIVTKEILTEIEVYKKEIEITRSLKKHFFRDLKNGPDNWIKIREMELDYIKNQDFFGMLTLGAEVYISFKLFEYNSNFIALPVRDSSDGNLEQLKEIAHKYQVDWVLNFPKIKLEKNDSVKKTIVTFQLYSILADKIIFQKEYQGINKNPYYEFTCEDDEDSWQCTLNNLESIALREILHEMDKNKQYWR